MVSLRSKYPRLLTIQPFEHHDPCSSTNYGYFAVALDRYPDPATPGEDFLANRLPGLTSFWLDLDLCPPTRDPRVNHG